MRSLSLALFTISQICLAHADLAEYEAVAIKVQPTGKVAIFEKSKDSKELIHSSSDQFRAEEVSSMNARIDTTLGETPWLVDSLFLVSRPQYNTGEIAFTIRDFEFFLQKVSSGECAKTISDYKTWRSALSKKENALPPKTILDAVKSARATVVEMCSRVPVNISVDPTYNGLQIWIAGDRSDSSGSSDILIDAVCKIKGFAGSSDSSLQFYQLDTPKKFAFPTFDEKGQLVFKVSELNPENGKAIPFLEKLNCWISN